MEVKEDFVVPFSFFCDKEKTLHYLKDFRDLLLKSDVIESEKLSDFYQSILFFHKNEIIKENYLNHNDSFDSKFYCDLKGTLQSILGVLSTKHLKPSLKNNEDIHSKKCNLVLEIMAYLIAVSQCNLEIDCLESLIDALCTFFEKIQSKLNSCYFVIKESEYGYSYYQSLKFLAKLLKHINLQTIEENLTESLVTRFIEVLPFPDNTTVKFFISNIFPTIIQISSLPLRNKIFSSVWNIINSQHKHSLEDNNSESASCAYNMLCCLSENIYDLNCQDTFFHNDKIFWSIILSGVTSNYPFTRKRALNVFKMFLLWWNRSGCKYSNSCQFMSSQCDDVKVWNDVIILFECLEEKQIHVIKPVLPKFSRILSLVSKQHNVSTTHDPFHLGSAWVMALICRILKHETKYVIRWGLSAILSLDYITYPIHKYDTELFVKTLVEVFNDQSLYARHSEQDNYSLFFSSDNISLFLKNFICTLESDQLKGDFLKCLINNIASHSWSVVALLHLILALTEVEIVPAWDLEHLLNVRKIILDCQRSQDPTFRAALEYCILKCCSMFIDWNKISWEDLADFLMLFKSPAILHDTKPWTQFASRLSDISTKDPVGILAKNKAYMFCSEGIKNILSMDNKYDAVDELGIERFCRILVLFIDASMISSSLKESHEQLTLTSLLTPVISTLNSGFKRPYMSDSTFLSALKLIATLIKEFDRRNQSNFSSMMIINYLTNQLDLFRFMYKKVIGADLCSKTISLHNIIFESFQILSNKDELKMYFLNIAIEISQLFNSEMFQNSNMLLIWRILNTIVLNIHKGESKNFLTEPAILQQKPLDKDLNFMMVLNKTAILSILKNNLLSDFLRKPIFVQENEKTQWLQFSHKMVCDVWDIIYLVTQLSESKDLEELAFPLLEEIQRAFNGGPKIAVPHSILCLKRIITIVGFKNLPLLHQVLDCSWKACFETRGNEAFRPSLNSLIEVIFQEHMLVEGFCEILSKYIDKFEELSENTSGIFCTVIQKFCKVYSIRALLKSKFNFLPVLQKALTYGPIHLKSHKIMEDTLIYVTEHNPSLANYMSLSDNNKPSFYVRIEVLKYLSLSYSEDFIGKDEFSFNLIENLMLMDVNSDGAYSQFANSFRHRLKNRAWQAILFLLPSIKNILILEKVFLLTFNYLGSENQQPSIRFMQEWVIFYICSTGKLDLFVSLFEESLEKRPSYLISVISILNLLILHQVLTDEDKLIRCFKLITVLCMAQNFTVRLYAQLTIMNICSLCKSLKIGKSILQYEFITQISKMQSTLSDQGNFFKNVKKLSQDFYFSAFSPVNHFTLETLYYDLPRLSNLCPDEWIKPSLLKINTSYLKIYNNDDNLKNSVSTSWSNKSNAENFASEDGLLDYNFQKKVMPTKDIIGDLENLNMFDCNIIKTNKKGLIVIASLIDRLPNLGGLCRTCEIFGVSEFVIGNMRFTEDKMFQNLAVSADKWVKTKEVKPQQLKDYLTSLKEDGYTLVGAEQTEDSHNLVEYKFPQKSALLLGHEKEGLPVDLIQLLDACVEIPQQGVIRSLNVHVSGAILIWEYARQNSTVS